MASGNVHTLITIVLTPLTTGAIWLFTNGDMATAAFVGAGCLSGIFISPDLDMEERTISESLLFRVSSLLGTLWMALWYPYAWLAKHRGVSHIPVLGTLTRLLYIGAIYLGIHFLLWYFFDLDMLSWLAARWQQGLFFATGLAVSDVGHWVLDGFRVHH